MIQFLKGAQTESHKSFVKTDENSQRKVRTQKQLIQQVKESYLYLPETFSKLSYINKVNIVKHLNE